MFAVDFGISGNILNFDAAGFLTNESSQFLLVAIYNVIYPITESVLHRVFDPYGYVEIIDILQASELVQAIIRFDSCQNASWAKSQLQGRDIYYSCCQLDIHFYKKIDNANQTGSILVENEFTKDLDFIRNKLHEIMVITEKMQQRMQDRIKAMNSSNLLRNAAANSAITTVPCTRSETISQPSNLDSIKMFSLEAATTFVDSESGQVYNGVIATLPSAGAPTSPTYFVPAAPSVSLSINTGSQSSTSLTMASLQPYMKTPTRELLIHAKDHHTDSPTHHILEHFSDSHIEFLFGIKPVSAMLHQISPDVHFFGIKPLVVLCMRKVLESTWAQIQQGADAQVMFVEMHIPNCGRKIFIFDPGGKDDSECLWWCGCMVMLSSMSDRVVVENEIEDFDDKEIDLPVGNNEFMKCNGVEEISCLQKSKELDLYEGPDEFIDVESKFSSSRLQNIVEIVMWKNISKSAFVFVFGSFILVSSSFTRDLNFSLLSALSYFALAFLFYKFILNRGMAKSIYQEDKCITEENEAVKILEILLPYINEVLLKLRALFSKDSATTFKQAILLFVMARFRDGRYACAHKKVVAAMIVAIIWSISSTVASIWSLFMPSSTSDLVDKVDFEAVVMIRSEMHQLHNIKYTSTQEGDTSPRKVVIRQCCRFGFRLFPGPSIKVIQRGEGYIIKDLLIQIHTYRWEL